jgi:molybdopterin converting factor subunit 1
MSIKILYFGAISEATGTNELVLDYSGSIRDLVARLKNTYPSLARHNLLVAVNEEYSDGSATLNDGDEVAIFTPVSGG